MSNTIIETQYKIVVKWVPVNNYNKWHKVHMLVCAICEDAKLTEYCCKCTRDTPCVIEEVK
jgi:hypothetical protein